jgi:hypothetical protein
VLAASTAHRPVVPVQLYIGVGAGGGVGAVPVQSAATTGVWLLEASNFLQLPTTPAGNGQSKEFPLELANSKHPAPICSYGRTGSGPLNLLPSTTNCVSCTQAFAVRGKAPSTAFFSTEKPVMSTKAPMLAGNTPLTLLPYRKLRGGRGAGAVS